MLLNLKILSNFLFWDNPALQNLDILPISQIACFEVLSCKFCILNVVEGTRGCQSLYIRGIFFEIIFFEIFYFG